MAGTRPSSIVVFLLLGSALDMATVHSRYIVGEEASRIWNIKEFRRPRSRLYGGAANITEFSQQERRGHVSITRVSSMGLLSPYFHDEDLGFSLFLERRCKWVWFIRHAEGFHNVAERQHELGTLYLQEVCYDSSLNHPHDGTAQSLENCATTGGVDRRNRVGWAT